MPNIKRIHKIKDEIKETTEVSLNFFGREFEKFQEKLEETVKAFNSESVKITKELVIACGELEKIQKETKDIKDEYTIYSSKIDKLNKREEEVKEREDEDLKLHKILVNKGKSLKAKETDLNEKERRLDDR